MKLREETRVLEQVIEQSLLYRNGGMQTEDFKQAMKFFITNKNEEIKMSNDKKFVAYKDELFKRAVARTDIASQVDVKGGFLIELIGVILEELDLIIWRTDKDGEIIRNDKGQPKVDWMKAIWNIGKLVGAFAALKEARNK